MFTIDLEPEVETTLKAIATQEHISLNEIFKQLVKQYIAKHELAAVKLNDDDKLSSDEAAQIQNVMAQIQQADYSEFEDWETVKARSKRNNLPWWGVLIFWGIILAAIFFPKLFVYVLDADLRRQGIQVESVQPLFDAVVTKKIKVGDSADDVKRILTYAGLSFSEYKSFLKHEPTLNSIYRAGEGCGISLQVIFDDSGRVTNIEVQPGFTSL